MDHPYKQLLASLDATGQTLRHPDIHFRSGVDEAIQAIYAAHKLITQLQWIPVVDGKIPENSIHITTPTHWRPLMPHDNALPKTHN